MKYCRYCDKTYPNDIKLCSVCGKGLTEMIEAKETKPIVHRMMEC